MSNTGMKIGTNNDINKDHKKLAIAPSETGKAEVAAPKMVKSTDKLIKDRHAAQDDPVGHKAHQVQQTDNQRLLAERHNDEKLIITILGLG